MSDGLEREVAAHYTSGGLVDRILQGLRQAGLSLDALSPEDLAPVDEFHTAGRITTLQALSLAPVEAGMRVLDAGCGLGGTSRHLAHERSCQVTGIDLTPEFVEAAQALTEWTGLGHACWFDVGSVLAMPYDDGAFDGAVTFHVAMNIGDRAGFYRELHRVVRPGGFLCLFDVMKGPAPGMVYPVPWAATDATSILKSRDETVQLLDRAGFRLRREANLRAFATDFFRKAIVRAAHGEGPPPLGLHLLLGESAPAKFANYLQALEAHQIEPVILVATRR